MLATMAKTESDETEDDKPILSATNVSVQFGAQKVLRNINLEVARGETLAIIGESGCGKTVLLKAMIGLVRPQQGEMLFDGRNLTTLDDRELARQRIRFGFVFQQAALFDSMTVAQNIGFPLRQHSDKRDSEIREIVMTRLAEVGLPEIAAQKKPAELSGGMRKRVGLARALAMNPEVVLYDEPTTGLDPIMSDVINELILRTRQRYPVTSIVVTHDMHTAHKIPDRIVMLYPLPRLKPDAPQIIFDGTSDELDRCRDPRVSQFVRGEAGERLMELRAAAGSNE
jgi:phospholipid/cholesterol/gamma-HCH transport system ATP-binding protein